MEIKIDQLAINEVKNYLKYLVDDMLNKKLSLAAMTFVLSSLDREIEEKEKQLNKEN